MFSEIWFSFKNNYSVGDILCFTFNLKQKIHRCCPKALKLTSLFEIRLKKFLALIWSRRGRRAVNFKVGRARSGRPQKFFLGGAAAKIYVICSIRARADRTRGARLWFHHFTLRIIVCCFSIITIFFPIMWKNVGTMENIAISQVFSVWEIFMMIYFSFYSLLFWTKSSYYIIKARILVVLYLIIKLWNSAVLRNWKHQSAWFGLQARPEKSGLLSALISEPFS